MSFLIHFYIYTGLKHPDTGIDCHSKYIRYTLQNINLKYKSKI